MAREISASVWACLADCRLPIVGQLLVGDVRQQDQVAIHRPRAVVQRRKSSLEPASGVAARMMCDCVEAAPTGSAVNSGQSENTDRNAGRSGAHGIAGDQLPGSRVDFRDMFVFVEHDQGVRDTLKHRDARVRENTEQAKSEHAHRRQQCRGNGQLRGEFDMQRRPQHHCAAQENQRRHQQQRGLRAVMFVAREPGPCLPARCSCAVSTIEKRHAPRTMDRAI